MTICRQIHGPRYNWFQWAGLNLLAIENECIRVVIWPAHGADLIEFRHKPTDLDALWKNSHVWPPRARALDQPHATRSEFYDTFHGGWFVSLPNGYFPERWPAPDGPALGCHGEMQSVPWDVDVIDCDENEVTVRAIGRSVRTPLRLERIWRLRAGSAILDWEETLHNDSATRLPVAWLHHPAFGGPLIEGAEVVTNAKQVVVPSSARPGISQLRSNYEGPWPHVPEESGGGIRDCSKLPMQGSSKDYVLHLKDFTYGWGAIWNESRRLGFGLRWDEKLFPYLWSWACGGGGDGYPLWGNCHTVTLQPSTSPLLPFPRLLEQNQVVWVDRHASVATRLSAGFTHARDEVFDTPA